MEKQSNPCGEFSSALCNHAKAAVNILTVERALITRINHMRILPEYERIRYGTLEPDEVGIALAFSKYLPESAVDQMDLEFTIWGRSCRAGEFRSYFRKLGAKIPQKECIVELSGGSRLAFAEITAPHGALFAPEHLSGVPVLNGALFLAVRLKLMESCFHADDIPSHSVRIAEEPHLPLLEIERSLEEYLRRKLRSPVAVEIDSLSPLRRIGGKEIRFRVSLLGVGSEAFVRRFPIIRPEFPNLMHAPLAILPDTASEDYFTVLCVY
ncbi:MAG: hypothetical protein LBM70_02570 [Victivallales bacterium]|jgi:hypothetical protein|nr:hypothetical protein [Victivallales bacterium]